MFLRKPLTLVEHLHLGLPRLSARGRRLAIWGTGLAGLTSVAVLALPRLLALVGPGIDAEVLLLFVPLCALVFALVFEVIRAGVGNDRRSQSSEPAAFSWTPGRGEG